MLKKILFCWLWVATAAVAEPSDLAVDFRVVKVEIGQGLVSSLVTGSAPPLLTGAKTLREKLYLERGLFFPGFHCIDSDQLSPKEYVISIREVEVGRGSLEPGRKAGRELLKPEEVILRHLRQLAVRHGASLLGRQDMLGMVPALLTGILSTDVPAQDCCLRVCQDLLRERVPLQFNRVAEIVLDSAQPRRDSDSLGELLRREFRQELCEDIAAGKMISAARLSSAWETRLQTAVRFGPAGLEIDGATALEDALAVPMGKLVQSNRAAVLCVRDDLRLALRRLTERQFPEVTVLARSEVAPGYTVKNGMEL